jgi:two-component system chemotaxis response regulator CheB
MKPPVRVLVVDDSALMRKLIPQILAADSSIQVVGTAMDGNFGLRKIAELKPNVITLDLEMPGMDGLEMLKAIMRSHRLPVIVVSSHSTAGATSTLRALSLGAFDFVAKPEDVSTRMGEIEQELITKIKAAAQAKVACADAAVYAPARAQKTAGNPGTLPSRVIAIGVSTGGPNALQYVLSRLPADFPASIVIVQHMPEGFTDMFAKRLDEVCAIRVKEAQSGDLLLASRALVCPGNRHLRVKRLPLGDVALLGDDPQLNGHRPSADILFRSVAHQFGKMAVGLVMTGMGEDGAAGLGAIRAAGGLTFAQSEETCVVFGMPKAAIDRGSVGRVINLDEVAMVMQEVAGEAPGPGGKTRQVVGKAYAGQ